MASTAAPRIVFIEDLSVTVANEPLSMDQVILSALFGGNFKVPAAYDSTKTYSANDKITRTDETGTPVIYACKVSGTTGTFDASKWSVYSLFDSSASNVLASDAGLVNALNNQTVANLINL